MTTTDDVSTAVVPPLPPYVYGRECGPNEKVWREDAVRAYADARVAAAEAQRAAAAELPIGEVEIIGDLVCLKVPAGVSVLDGDPLYRRPQPAPVPRELVGEVYELSFSGGMRDARWIDGVAPPAGSRLYTERAPTAGAPQGEAMRCDECVNHFVCPNCGKRTNEVASLPAA